MIDDCIRMLVQLSRKDGQTAASIRRQMKAEGFTDDQISEARERVNGTTSAKPCHDNHPTT